jgi:hypothetical protein
VITKLRSVGMAALIWIALIYLAIALYGRFMAAGTSAFYSKEIDATCVIERSVADTTMSCIPGNRISRKEPAHD